MRRAEFHLPRIYIAIFAKKEQENLKYSAEIAKILALELEHHRRKRWKLNLNRVVTAIPLNPLRV